MKKNSNVFTVFIHDDDYDDDDVNIHRNNPFDVENNDDRGSQRCKLVNCHCDTGFSRYSR